MGEQPGEAASDQDGAVGAQQIDITRENCPMTFVRTKLALERLAPGALLVVRLRDGEALTNVPRAVADHGHEVLSVRSVAGAISELVIRKAADRRR